MIQRDERIAVLETQHLQLREDVSDIRQKVDSMHNILMQAKGARWAILSISGFAGMIAGLATKMLPFWTK